MSYQIILKGAPRQQLLVSSALPPLPRMFICCQDREISTLIVLHRREPKSGLSRAPDLWNDLNIVTLSLEFSAQARLFKRSSNWESTRILS